MCTKVIKTTLLGALFSAGAAFAAPAPADMAGNYQALLYTQEGDTGSPTALITLAVTNKGALTGKLTTEENKTYPFKATLDYVAANTLVEGSPLGTATTSIITISRGKNVPAWYLALNIQDFTDTDTVEATLSLDETAVGSTTNGFKQITFAKGAQPYEAAGAYTLAFELANAPGPNDPAGSGYAVGSIDAKGLLKLTGKTGDGTAFTAALPAGPDYRFVTFLNPYKRINSFFAGKITLTERTDGDFHMLPAETGYDFQWKKSSLLPKTTDKSYRAAFGPLDVLVSMEPWTAPGKNETVGQKLGLSVTEIFNIAFDGGLSTSTYSRFLPATLGLDAKNGFRIASGLSGSPGSVASGWTKIFTIKLDPKTGKITAAINIEDSIPTTNPLRPKIVKRKVIMEGVMLALEEGDTSPLAQGFVLVPPRDAKTDTTLAGQFAFTGPVIEDTAFAKATATAGTYRATFNLQPNGGLTLPTLPKLTAPLTFTVASDLQSIVFAGKKVPISGAPTITAIVFSNAQASPLNNMLITLNLNVTTGAVINCSVQYFQAVRSGFSVDVRQAIILSDNATLVKIQ